MKNILALFQQSLFIRLMAIFLFSVTLFVFIMGCLLTYIYREEVKTFKGFEFFERHVNFLIDDFGYPPNLDKPRELMLTFPMIIIIKDSKGNLLLGNAAIDLNELVTLKQYNDRSTAVSVGRTRGLRIERNSYQYFIFGHQPLIDKHDALVGALTTTVVLLVLFINYLLVRHLLKPINLLKEGAERISRGELDYRVKHTHRDELGTLTDSINDMADSLNAMIDAKQQLLLGISHELRTPITRAKIQLEMMPDDEARKNLMEDIDELDRLVSELLEAEKLQSQHSGLVLEPLAISVFTRETLNHYWPNHPLIKWQQPDDGTANTEIPLDKLRYQVIVRNLIGNALKYGDENEIDVAVKCSHDESTLTVRDHGQGIPAEHLPHITEPFYRSDSARQRQTGGFGLGLHLCRIITEAHGGVLEITSEEGKGTAITVHLPNDSIPLKLPQLA